MASPTDQLRTLPPELREYVYSNLLSVDGDSAVQIRQRQKTGDRSPYAEDPPTVLTLFKDSIYAAHRRGILHQKRPDEVDEAIFQVLNWTSKQHPHRRIKWAKAHHEIISELIYELTGESRPRRQVPSHIQVLKEFLQRGRTQTAQCVDTKQISNVVKPRPRFSFETSPVLIEKSEIFRYLSTIACNPNHGLSVHCNTDSAKNLLSLGSVSRLYRAECIHHLASNLAVDFKLDSRALLYFCSTAPAELLAPMRHVRVTLVEGYMPPQLPDWANLRTLAIDLWPRNPTRPDRKVRAWGAQTEMLLAALGTVVAVRARIKLEMRWDADCERFEREYVERGRWRRVVEADDKGAPDQGDDFVIGGTSCVGM